MGANVAQETIVIAITTLRDVNTRTIVIADEATTDDIEIRNLEEAVVVNMMTIVEAAAAEDMTKTDAGTIMAVAVEMMIIVGPIVEVVVVVDVVVEEEATVEMELVPPTSALPHPKELFRCPRENEKLLVGTFMRLVMSSTQPCKQNKQV
jgi:hypothetical protein